jgi:hypothetical protein
MIISPMTPAFPYYRQRRKQFPHEPGVRRSQRADFNEMTQTLARKGIHRANLDEEDSLGHLIAKIFSAINAVNGEILNLASHLNDDEAPPLRRQRTIIRSGSVSETL